MAALLIPDEILAEIFLLLPSPADLIRASVVCVSFRRVAAGRSFVRRFRKLHHPPLLGFLDRFRTFYPAISPHPSEPAAFAADFSFSFLPAPAANWVVQDSRDGRVLLHRPRLHHVSHHRDHFTELVVCDPLHRRFRLLPPIPDHLAHTVETPMLLGTHSPETFLIPRCSKDDEAAETSFRVIGMWKCHTKVFAFVFSSTTGKWRAIPSWSWNDLLPGFLSWTSSGSLYSRQYVYGCFYWRTGWAEGTKFLVLDTLVMKFSTTTPPCEAKYNWDVAMVEAGEGRPGKFVLTYGGSAAELCYSIVRQNDGGSSSQWQIKNRISLGSGYLFNIIGSVDRYLFLYRWQNKNFDYRVFALDVKTFQLQEVCHGPEGCKLHVYINFPSSVLSLPTISYGVENEAEETLEQGCAESSSE